MLNLQLDDLIFAQSDNSKLVESLKFIQPRATSGSLAIYNEFEFDELHHFKQIYQLEVEDTITGFEFFPGKMLSSKKINIGLLNEIYNILVEYYNNAYDMEFLSIVKSVQKNLKRTDSRIIVLPQNSFILVKFVQENSSIEVFLGQVQYFFEHKVCLPEVKIHHLTYE
ncbi:3134_t:CDS:2, partial [Racocetra persica]